jgi:site-specific DNA-cytosine methylase
MQQVRTIGALAGGAGCGSYGAILAGYSPRWSIDNWGEATFAYRRNLGRSAHTIDLLEAEPSNYPTVDGIIGSPSCKSYSDANVGGNETDYDIAVSKVMGRWIFMQRPAFALIENVLAYGREDSKAWEELREFLLDGSYTIKTMRLNAINYGCTQTRKRFYAIAYDPRRVSFEPPPPTHGKNLLPFVGWGENFRGQRELLLNLPKDTLTPNCIKSLANRRSMEPVLIARIGWRDQPTVWPMDIPMGTIRATLANDHKSGRSKYLTLWVPDNTGKNPLKGQAYNITTPALAALMGLPTSWKWSGKPMIDVQLIGNGIIPHMAKTILSQIKWL